MTAFPKVRHACAAPWRPKYTWDPDEPRLTRVQGPGGVDVSYSYDSAGRMLTRTSGGITTTFEWDGWTMVKETTGSVVTRYIAPQGQIHSFERGGQVYQVHSDAHNGSVRAITDASGAVVAHYEFDAWGAQLASSSAFSGGFSYGYVGGLGVRTDEATGLIWMRQRWYDAGLGRFLSRDPLRGINLYGYSSHPIDGIDPMGTSPPEGGWISTLITNVKNSVEPWVEEMMTPNEIAREVVDRSAAGEGINATVGNRSGAQQVVNQAKNLATLEGAHDIVTRSDKAGLPGGTFPRRLLNKFQGKSLAHLHIEIQWTKDGPWTNSHIFYRSLGFLGLFLTGSAIANADPCERPSVAANEATSWLAGLGLARLAALAAGGPEMLALVGTTYLVKEAGPAVSTWVGDKAGWVSDRVYEDPTVNYLMNDIVNYMLSEGRYSNW